MGVFDKNVACIQGHTVSSSYARTGWSKNEVTTFDLTACIVIMNTFIRQQGRTDRDTDM